MVKIMLASHGNLAAGMLSSAEMVFGKQDNVSVICAYVDGEDDVSTRIKGFIDSIAPDDSWIIFTDLFGGSVNNEFMKYISNPQNKAYCWNESGTCYNSNVYIRNEK